MPGQQLSPTAMGKHALKPTHRDTENRPITRAVFCIEGRLVLCLLPTQTLKANAREGRWVVLYSATSNPH